jgi:hypothetical protein
VLGYLAVKHPRFGGRVRDMVVRQSSGLCAVGGVVVWDGLGVGWSVTEVVGWAEAEQKSPYRKLAATMIPSILVKTRNELENVMVPSEILRNRLPNKTSLFRVAGITGVALATRRDLRFAR